MTKELNIIAVDLTPVLPGGENGGAKIFVLELLRYLAKMHPETQFVLLTQAASHKELADKATGPGPKDEGASQLKGDKP